MRVCYLALFLSLSVHASPTFPEITPNKIFPANDYRKTVRQVENGILFSVEAPNTLPFMELHVFGNAYQRGQAQGELLSDTLVYFLNTALPAFYRDEVNEIPLKKLPEWLQELIVNAAQSVAPQVFNTALQWVYNQQEEYIKASKANVIDEMEGIAHGLCSARKTPCNETEWTAAIKYVNMLPELIRMQCSMLGAWGKSSPSGSLVQLRTLDFGSGPWGNYTMLTVQHPDDGPAFAQVGFPGFVAAVTGFSEKIGLSEKVDDVTGGNRPHGTYDGQSVSMVIRDILQFATTKEQAVEIAMKAHRTWSVWLGFGDFISQEFVSILYDEANVIPLDDETLPFFTNATRVDGVAYIDKHPQPSNNPDLPSLIASLYGKLDAATIIGNIPQQTKSGDVHIAAYDFGTKQAYIARGINTPDGEFSAYAYESPFLQYDMEALWAVKPSAEPAKL